MDVPVGRRATFGRFVEELGLARQARSARQLGQQQTGTQSCPPVTWTRSADLSSVHESCAEADPLDHERGIPHFGCSQLPSLERQRSGRTALASSRFAPRSWKSMGG